MTRTQRFLLAPIILSAACHHLEPSLPAEREAPPEQCCRFGEMTYLTEPGVAIPDPVFPDPPSALSCNKSGGTVHLSWKVGGPYSHITVFRGFQPVATLPGSATSYVEPYFNRYNHYAVNGKSSTSDLASEYAECLLPVDKSVLSAAIELNELPDSTVLHEEYTKKYGEEAAGPFEGGFVFVDGRYIEAPYTVQRIGLTLYINGIAVSPLPPFRFTAEGPVRDSAEPEMPSDLAHRSLREPDVLNYLDNYWNYVLRSEARTKPFSAARAHSRLDSFLKALPLLASASNLDEEGHELVARDGSRLIKRFIIYSGGFDVHKYTELDKHQWCVGEFDSLTKSIKRSGSASFYVPGTGSSHLPVASLKAVLEALREERMRLNSPRGDLGNLLLSEFATTLRRNFVENDQLSFRLLEKD